jgi:large subunit ribosomal protein L35
MPKIKSNSGAAKRFKVTGSGKVKRHQSHKRHILTKKSAKRKRLLRPTAVLNHSDVGSVQRMLPYSF